MENYINAGKIHKKVRDFLQNYELNNKSIKDVVNKIEEIISSNDILKNQKNNGIAFPVGISINDCCAHNTYSPFLKSNTILKDGDIVKIDYGVHIDGYIVDGAYSYTIGNKNKEKNNVLMSASKDALITAIKNIGVDTILGELGETIQEVIESYEYEEKGKVYKCVPIYDLCGHKIDRYKIHAGKAVPNIKINYKERVEANEIYAIEPFVTFNNGMTYLNNNICNHFMLNDDNNISDNFYKILYNKFSTLPFCDNWIKDEMIVNNISINNLKKLNYIKSFPGIYTYNKETVSQFEKTIFISNTNKIVLN